MKVARFLSEKSVNYKLLIKQIGTLICRQLNTKLFSYHNDDILGVTKLSIEFSCTVDNHFLFGETVLPSVCLLCINAKGSGMFHFTSTHTHSGLIYSPKHLYFDGYEPKYPIVLLDFDKSFGARNMDYTLSSTQTMNARSRSLISGLYKSDSLKRKPCGMDISFRECEIHCKGEMIRNRCKCAPVSYSHNIHLNESVCGSYATDTSSVDSLKVPFVTEGNCDNLTLYGLGDVCAQNCHESCETLLFVHTVTTLPTNQNQLGYRYLAIESLMTFQFPEIIEFLSMGRKDLITSLGGNLSLWLGASFLALIHIVSTMVPCA